MLIHLIQQQKSDLGSLKAEVDKIDIDKLKTVHPDLSKLSNVVDNDVVRKTLYDKLVTKVNEGPPVVCVMT